MLRRALVGWLLFALTFSWVQTICADDAKPPIKVGAIFSISSWAAIGGQVEQNATILAVEDINAKGGINGRQLDVVYEDNHSDLPQTVTAFNKLVNSDRIVALLGPNWAEFGEVVAPLAEQKKIPMLSASAFSWTLTKGRKFIFTDVPDYNVQVAPLGKYILDQHHHKTALLYSSSTYFEGLANAIRDYMKAAGTPLAEVINLNPKEMSLNSVLARLQKSGVDSLIIFLQEGGDVPNLFRQARTLKYKPQIYSYDLAYDDVLVKDWHLADDAVFFAYTGKFERGLYERYKARFNSEPPWTVPKAYDNVFILKEAIEKCGDYPTAIRDCLSKTDYHGTSGHIRYADSGNIIGVEKITELKKVVDGKVIPLPELGN